MLNWFWDHRLTLEQIPICDPVQLKMRTKHDHANRSSSFGYGFFGFEGDVADYTNFWSGFSRDHKKA
jgi:hypothetical protein